MDHLWIDFVKILKTAIGLTIASETRFWPLVWNARLDCNPNNIERRTNNFYLFSLFM